MSSIKNKKKLRGGGLLLVAYLGALMGCTVGVYFFYSSHNLSSEATIRENAAAAQNVAEFAAEVARSNLSNLRYKQDADGKRVSIEADWVLDNPYGSGDLSAERRFAGNLNSYDYRVRVRAVRETKEKDIMPENWLSEINPKEYVYGTDSVEDFSGAYEITAVARSAARMPSGSAAPAQAVEGTVRTVVNLDYNGLAADVNKLAVLYVLKPELFVKNGAEIAAGNEPAPEIEVAGEDHYGIRAVGKDPGIEVVIEGLASIASIPSQLFSVGNFYWSSGAMTLQYKKGDEMNPFVPRTATFGSTEPRRKMIALNPDESVEHDQYVFGGKQGSTYFSMNHPDKPGFALVYQWGRSVTLTEDGTEKIIETAASQANPSKNAETSLAVGKPENILNLYLNYVMPRVSNTSVSTANPPPIPHPNDSVTDLSSWRSQWWQLGLGNHSKARIHTTRMPPEMRPLDNSRSGAKRRWSILIWIKDEDGNFLCRDYSNDSTYINMNVNSSEGHPPSPGTWNGRYRWYRYLGYTDAASSRWHMGQSFHHSDTYRKRLAIHPRFLTIEELLGYKFHKDKDGVAAKLRVRNESTPEVVMDDSNIVAGMPDYFLVSGEKVPFEVNGSQFDELAQRVNTKGDNYGLPNNLSSFPPADGLYVYNPATNDYERKQTLRDFSFVRNIAKSGEPRDDREMVNFHMVIEDAMEQTGNNENLYYDMGLTVTLVFPKKTSDVVTDESSITEALRQWWEGERQQTLTGKISDIALCTRPDSELGVVSEGDDAKLKEYFDRFGISYLTDPLPITGAKDQDGKAVGFNRVTFDADLNMGMFRDPDGTSYYYFGEDDLHQFIAASPDDYLPSALGFSMSEIDDISNGDEALNAEFITRRNAKAIEVMTNKYPGHVFKPLESRFENGRELATLEENEMFPLSIPDKDITPRSIAAQSFGVSNPKVRSVYLKKDPITSDYVRMKQNDVNPHGDTTEIPEVSKAVPFIAGEIDVQDQHLYQDSTNPWYLLAKMRDNGTVQPNGRLLEPTLIWEAGSTVLPGEETIDMIHTVPDWFATTFADIYSENRREHRGRLGWHRAGANPNVATAEDPDKALAHYQDNYVFAVMSRKGFVPYRTYVDTDSDGRSVTYLALVKPEDLSEVALEQCKPEVLPPSEMPTFVIEGNEIDGAGILVVNGNLDIRTRFAYHGLLVVLGNITVTPTSTQLKNAEGKYLDENNNPLEYDTNNRYYYYLDENGQKVRSDPAKSWLGELIVQGKVMVGGEIITNEGTDNDGGSATGKVDIRGSREAIKETVGLWKEVAPYEMFVSNVYGWTTGTSTGTGSGYNLWGD